MRSNTLCTEPLSFTTVSLKHVVTSEPLFAEAIPVPQSSDEARPRAGAWFEAARLCPEVPIRFPLLSGPWLEAVCLAELQR